MSVIEIRGEQGVLRMLKAYTNPTLRKRLQSATKAGGNEVKGPLRAESASVSKRMGKAVTVIQSPSSLSGRHSRVSDPHVYVGYRRKTAPFAHMVIGGTKDHGPRKAPVMIFTNPPVGVRASFVRGVKANPIVSRVASRHESAIYRAIDRDLDKTEPK